MLESGPKFAGLNHEIVDFITKIKELSPSEDWVVDVVTTVIVVVVTVLLVSHQTKVSQGSDTN